MIKAHLPDIVQLSTMDHIDRKWFIDGGICVALSIGLVTSRVGTYITMPLWLDYFSNQDSPWINTTNSTTSKMYRENVLSIGHFDPVPLFPAKKTTAILNPHFILVARWGFTAFICGLVLIILRCVQPMSIKYSRQHYPISHIFPIGFAQGVSATLATYSWSGTRVAPYLQGLLINFSIPIQFFTR